jgi:hypothetical protein
MFRGPSSMNPLVMPKMDSRVFEVLLNHVRRGTPSELTLPLKPTFDYGEASQ